MLTVGDARLMMLSRHVIFFGVNGCILCRQLRIRAQDKGIPLKEAQTIATVFVARNPSSPTFTSDVYRMTISEDFSKGASILSVSAIDDDNVSVW